MPDELTHMLASLQEAFNWIPPTAIGIALLAFAVLLALALHRAVARLLRRILARYLPFAVSLLASAGDVTRYALVILALSLVLPAAPLDPGVTGILAKLLLLATIAL